MIVVNKKFEIITTGDILFEPTEMTVIGYEKIPPQSGVEMIRVHTIATEKLPDGELTRIKWTDYPEDLFLQAYTRDKLTGEVDIIPGAANLLLSPHNMQLKP